MKGVILSADQVYELYALSEELQLGTKQNQKKIMKCPNCGEEMVRTPDKILASDPPMYEMKCPKCGVIKYEVIHKIDTQGVESGQLFVLPDPWHEFRCNAAKDFITGMMANPHYNMKADCTIVERSIELADELIRQLREEK